MPLTAEIKRICALPRMALAMPPPSSPGGLGSCVKKSRFSDLPPFQTRNPRIQKSTQTAARAHAAVRLNIKPFTSFLQWCCLMNVPSWMRRSTPRGRQYHEACKSIDHNGQKKKYKP